MRVPHVYIIADEDFEGDNVGVGARMSFCEIVFCIIS